jgi:hypothetical protein
MVESTKGLGSYFDGLLYCTMRSQTMGRCGAARYRVIYDSLDEWEITGRPTAANSASGGDELRIQCRSYLVARLVGLPSGERTGYGFESQSILSLTLNSALWPRVSALGVLAVLELVPPG